MVVSTILTYQKKSRFYRIKLFLPIIGCEEFLYSMKNMVLSTIFTYQGKNRFYRMCIKFYFYVVKITLREREKCFTVVWREIIRIDGGKNSFWPFLF